MENWTNLSFTLTWLAGAGAPILSMAFFAEYIEKIPAWHKLHKTVKFIVPMVVSVLLSIGATYLLSNTDIVELLAPHFGLMAVAVLAYLQSQKTHRNTKSKG